MKKLLITLVAAFALCIGASAQRTTVPYAGISINFNNANDVGAGVVGGFRNYNRDKFLSVGVGAEAYTYFLPVAKQFGVFAVPEIGLAIGPRGFKVYPHTGLMFGYDTYTEGFAWGGKNGLAFDFGKSFTLDFSTYTPNYTFRAITYAIGMIWRFGN
ncbi:MAG: hypothetical protein J5640_01405 [Bacteroidales bacterium]|nr:hypothetical protein [Bacteroidales bacterium]